MSRTQSRAALLYLVAVSGFGYGCSSDDGGYDGGAIAKAGTGGSVSKAGASSGVTPTTGGTAGSPIVPAATGGRAGAAGSAPANLAGASGFKSTTSVAGTGGSGGSAPSQTGGVGGVAGNRFGTAGSASPAGGASVAGAGLAGSGPIAGGTSTNPLAVAGASGSSAIGAAGSATTAGSGNAGVAGATTISCPVAGAASAGESRSLQSIIVSLKGLDCYDCAKANCSGRTDPSDSENPFPDVVGSAATSTSCDNVEGTAVSGPAVCQSRKTLCHDAVSCMLQNDCAYLPDGTAHKCYCGTSTDCLNGVGVDGACRLQIEAAFETSSASQIGAQFVNLTLPVAAVRANRLVQCLAEAVTYGGPEFTGDPKCNSCFE